MAKKEEANKQYVYKNKQYSSGGAVYGMGLIGALVYFVSNASSFGDGLIGVLKAFVWPAFAVYGLLGFLKL